MRELCHLQSAIDSTLTPFFAQLTPYRNMWSLANYATCLSPLYHLNCSYMTDEDIYSLESIIDYCRHHRMAIIACGMLDGSSPCPHRLPINCTSRMLFDIFYRILPVDLDSSSSIMVNTFLPIFTYTSYMSQGYMAASLDKFARLDAAIVNYADTCNHIKLRGGCSFCNIITHF